MKALARLVLVLVVLGFCLPSYGEILVYKCTGTGTEFDKGEDGWELNKKTYKGYVVIDVDYTTNTIRQAELISYRKHGEGKWFEQNPLDLELVRVIYDTKIQWVVMQKGVLLEGEEIVAGGFAMLAGQARNRNIGIEETKEVPSSLSGYDLWDETDEGGGRYLSMSKITLTLYPSWTYWANGDDEDEGNQDFELTKQMIKDYLIGKGYTE
jgi:hypothetical protein